MTPAEAQATALARSYEAMGLEALREAWRRLYGPPPTLRSPDLLRRLLAWRVQADAMGGLDRKLVRDIIAAAKTGRARKAEAPQGARISKEWQGRVHEVEVVEGGYLHEGRRYRSLSAIARQITGVRWNGPKFFGLREEAAG